MISYLDDTLLCALLDVVAQGGIKLCLSELHFRFEYERFEVGTFENCSWLNRGSFSTNCHHRRSQPQSATVEPPDQLSLGRNNSGSE